MQRSSINVTQLLIDWSKGDQGALEQLIPLVYNELRRIAKGYLQRERPDHTLQATALVNEAYLRLVDQTKAHWQNRAHFFGVAASLMRQILVSYAVYHRADKRGPYPKLSLDEAIDLPEESKSNLVELIMLDDALKHLAQLDPQQSRIVELRYFGGLTIEETAEVMGNSPATIKREWNLAKAWLHCKLTKGDLA